MQITINQQEIEEAIRKHILSQISLRENMKVEIDMTATRGPSGFTATINIVPEDASSPEQAQDAETSNEDGAKAETTARPLGIKEKITDAREETEKPKTTRKAPAKKADKPKAKVEPEPEPETEEDTSEQEPEQEPETETAAEPVEEQETPPARKGPSIFSNLKKPTNKEDDE